MELELTRIFVKVVQHGGFSRAAASLGMPKSTVSKAVSRLEKETGTKLLLRTTRRQTLTASGRLFYETCLGPVQTLEDAQKSLYGMDNIVSGTIKLTAPEDLGNRVVTPVIASLLRKYPRLEFELNYTNEVLDLVRDGYDLAVRIGPLPESSFLQRRAGGSEMVPVASPKYLKARDRIREPKDLESHACLNIAGTSMVTEWVLRSDRRPVRVKVRSNARCNQVTSLVEMALAGAGVALVPKFFCIDELESGRLARVLPDWCGESFPVFLVSPVSTTASARLSLVSSELMAALKDALGG